ncbi:MAG TPA: arylesterase [Arenibaculum sp.]|nr:arylesterase [Arenibaculum sp.]
MNRGRLRRYGPARRLFNVFALIALAAAALVPLAAPSTAHADPVRLLALGDSLTAGYGLAPEDSFPAQLQSALRTAGYDVEVINAGVSGDTTAGGLARLDWSLVDDPDLVLVALGANDGLRGIDPATTRANLDAILERLTGRGLPVLVAGMYAPPNLGRAYGEAFNAIFPDLAEKYGAALYPFFLEGIAMVPDLNQDDGIHPNARGVAVMVDGILPHVEPLVEAVQG